MRHKSRGCEPTHLKRLRRFPIPYFAYAHNRFRFLSRHDWYIVSTFRYARYFCYHSCKSERAKSGIVLLFIIYDFYLREVRLFDNWIIWLILLLTSRRQIHFLQFRYFAVRSIITFYMSKCNFLIFFNCHNDTNWMNWKTWIYSIILYCVLL